MRRGHHQQANSDLKDYEDAERNRARIDAACRLYRERMGISLNEWNRRLAYWSGVTRAWWDSPDPEDLATVIERAIPAQPSIRRSRLAAHLRTYCRDYLSAALVLVLIYLISKV